MRKPNIQLKQAKLIVEKQRLTAIESQYNTLNTKVKQVWDRLNKKQALVAQLESEINLNQIDTVETDPTTVS